MPEPNDLISSIFWGNARADEPLSYQSLLTRRKIAEALQGRRSPYPKTIGEGLSAIGEAIGDRGQLAQLDAAERAQAARDAETGKTIAGVKDPSLRDYDTPTTPYQAPAPVQPPTAAPPSNLPPPAATPQIEAGRNAIAAAATPPATGADMTAAPPAPRPPMTLPPAGPGPSVARLGPMGGATNLNSGTTRYLLEQPDTTRFEPTRALGPSPDVPTANVRALRSDEYTTPQVLTGEGRIGGPMSSELTGIPDQRQASLSPDSVATAGFSPDRTAGRAQVDAQVAASGPDTPLAPTPAMARDRLATALQAQQAGRALPGYASAPAAPGPTAAADLAPAATPGQVPSSGAFMFPKAASPPLAAGPAAPGAITTAPGAGAGGAVPPVTVEPMPPPYQIAVPHPGPMPVRPDVMHPTDDMRKLFAITRDPRASTEIRETAKARLEQMVQAQNKIYEARVNDFIFEREDKNKRLHEWEKNVREMPKEQFEQYLKRLDAQAKTADLLKKPDEAAKLRAEATAAWHAIQSGKSLEPATKEMNGVWNYYDAKADKWRRVAADEPELKDLKPNEFQSNTIAHLQMATYANAALGKNDTKLTGFVDNYARDAPLVGKQIANYLASPEYQANEPYRRVWVKSMLRKESGAVLNDKEIEEQVKDYFAVPGDEKNPQAIENKRALRDMRERTWANTLGNVRPIYDAFKADRVARRVTDPEGLTEGQTFRWRGKPVVFRNGYIEDID